MIDKAWKKVSLTTLYNCYRECGFHMQRENARLSPKWRESANFIPPDSGRALLPNCGELTFQDFVHVDDEIGVYDSLSEAELLGATCQDEDEEDNE